MDILEKVCAEYDFAILVLTPDDTIMRQEAPVNVARNNVVLEAGLFIASWGLERVFLFQIRGANMVISDLLGIEIARLNWPGSYQLPIDKAALEIYNTQMQEALREDISPGIEVMLGAVGKRGLSIPLYNIVQTTRELERLYRHGKTVDELFLKHLGRHMEKLYDEFLRQAQRGELSLKFAEEEALPAILADAERSVKAVAHYTNIGWWTNNPKAKTYLAIHENLRRKVYIQRIFILPVMSLLESEVQEAIEASCRLDVDVRLLLWRTEDTKPSITLEDKTHDTNNISQPPDMLKYPALPGWPRNIEDELSFLIVDDELVSYSNIPARNREEPSKLFTHRPGAHSVVVDDAIKVFNKLFDLGIRAERLFPSFFEK